MALRQQEHRKDDDETREPDADGGEVLMGDAALARLFLLLLDNMGIPPWIL